jgi:integrase/recombinase XerC
MAALRSLVQLARTFGMVAWTLEVKNVRSEAYRDTKGPGLQGVKRLLNETKRRKTPKSIRDHLALRLLFDLALRCGEVVSLTVEDVDLERGTVMVRGKGKTSKQALTLPDPTKAALEEWLEIRGNEPGVLFKNFDRAKKGDCLTGVSLYRIVRRLGEKIGVKARPHGLRHTAITEACKMAAAHSIGLEEVLDFSRHSRKSISVLLVYRDQERNLQGQLASMVAAQTTTEAAPLQN